MSLANWECLACGKHFQRPKGTNWLGKYCSRDCHARAMTTILDAACLTCGEPVQAPKGSGQRQRGKKYCGRECYYASIRGKPSKKNTRVLLSCTVCCREVVVKAYRAVEFKYCSRECYLTVHTADNVTPEFKRLRNSAAYQEWRTAVFERDDYTCQSCGQRGGGLQADHIKTFAHHPELRFDVSNGRTLCVPCHKETPTYGVRAWREFGRGRVAA